MQHARGTKSCGIKLRLRRTDGLRQYPRPSAGRLKAAGKAEAAAVAAAQARQRTTLRDARDEGRWFSLFYFWKEKKGRAVKRAREKQLRARLLLSPHLSCVLEENESQLIKMVCAAAAVERVNNICAGETQTLWSLPLWLCGKVFFF